MTLGVGRHCVQWRIDLQVAEEYIYMIHTSGLKILDASDFSAINVVGQYTAQESTHDIFVKDQFPAVMDQGS